MKDTFLLQKIVLNEEIQMEQLEEMKSLLVQMLHLNLLARIAKHYVWQSQHFVFLFLHLLVSDVGQYCLLRSFQHRFQAVVQKN